MPTTRWQPSPRDDAALHVENHDRSPHDVAVTVTDGDGETVFDAEFAVWHGDDAVHHDVFTTDGPYEVTVSVRYGPTQQLTHDDGPLYVTLTDETAPTDVGDAATDEPGGSTVERNV